MGNHLLGIPLSDMGLRETLRKTNEYMKTGGLSTIAYVSTPKLIMASEDEEQKHWWMSLDMIVYEEPEVLKAIGITAPSRIKEVEEKKYLKEVLRIFAKGQKTIFLLADTREKLETFEEELKKIQSNLCIVGKTNMEEYPGNKESLINDMNLQAPEIILSQLLYPLGIQMMHNYGNYLNASLWLALPEKINGYEKQRWLDKINKIIYKKLLNRIINHSKATENEEM